MYDDLSLLEEAKKAQKNAYAPYSKYHLGVCIVTTNQKRFYGVNIENASYPAGICAERSALSAMITAGEKSIERLALISDGQTIPSPCGICRQVLNEFAAEMIIIASTNHFLKNQHYQQWNLSELMPHAFNQSHLS